MEDLGKWWLAVEGNTVASTAKSQQGHRKTFYAFTLYNYDKDDLERHLTLRLNQIARKYIYGREICPKTQRKHLQGFIALKKPMRITELRLPGNPHLEATVGTEEQNVRYCSKEGDYVKYGFPKEIQLISNLRPWQKSIENILLQDPDDRKVYWYWEPNGNIGKSAFVKYCVVKHNALFCDGGKKADIINLVFNNDMDKCNIIIWDIPRCNEGSVSYSAIESVKNGLVCNTKYETGVKVFNSPHIIIFANFPPNSPESLSKDRWVITEIIITESFTLLYNN